MKALLSGTAVTDFMLLLKIRCVRSERAGRDRRPTDRYLVPSENLPALGRDSTSPETWSPGDIIRANQWQQFFDRLRTNINVAEIKHPVARLVLSGGMAKIGDLCTGPLV